MSAQVDKLEALLRRVETNKHKPRVLRAAIAGPVAAPAPAVSSAPAAPAVSAPAVSAPAVSAPAVSTPVSSAPAVSAPAVSTPVSSAPAASSDAGSTRRRRVSTPLEQVIEDASARTGEEDVTTPGIHRAPSGPPIDDLAASGPSARRAPVAPAGRAPVSPPAAVPQAPAETPAPAAVHPASVAPPSAPIATTVHSEFIDTSAATFGAMFAQALKLRPR